MGPCCLTKVGGVLKPSSALGSLTTEDNEPHVQGLRETSSSDHFHAWSDSKYTLLLVLANSQRPGNSRPCACPVNRSRTFKRKKKCWSELITAEKCIGTVCAGLKTVATRSVLELKCRLKHCILTLWKFCLPGHRSSQGEVKATGPVCQSIYQPPPNVCPCRLTGGGSQYFLSGNTGFCVFFVHEAPERCTRSSWNVNTII